MPDLQRDAGAKVQDRLREFLKTQFPKAAEPGFRDDTRLLDAGIVDSLGILEIVQFLSEEFGLEVSDLDLVPENFESVEALAAFVERKRQAAAG